MESMKSILADFASWCWDAELSENIRTQRLALFSPKAEQVLSRLDAENLELSTDDAYLIYKILTIFFDPEKAQTFYQDQLFSKLTKNSTTEDSLFEALGFWSHNVYKIGDPYYESVHKPLSGMSLEHSIGGQIIELLSYLRSGGILTLEKTGLQYRGIYQCIVGDAFSPLLRKEILCYFRDLFSENQVATFEALHERAQSQILSVWYRNKNRN